MSAEIIQFRPRPNPTRDQQTLEQLATETAAIALNCDTAPSEMNPYTAPLDDPA